MTMLLGAVATVSLPVAVIGIAGVMPVSVTERTREIPDLSDAVIDRVAFLFPAATGVMFGCLPARRAVQLDPVEALRHESCESSGDPAGC
jgi:putative ABC transport system permease protein